MLRPRRAAVAAVAALVLAGAWGCGDDPGDPTFTPTSGTPPDAAGVTLRAELASLASEHPFLVSDAVRTGARIGFDSPAYEAAVDHLHESTAKLVDEVSPLLRGGTADKLERRLTKLFDLTLLYGREQIEPVPDEPPIRSEIAGHVETITALLANASPHLEPRDVRDQLEVPIDELLLALDRIDSDARGQLAHTAAAAHRSRGLAGLLATAIADARDEGDAARSVAARLYADLRTLLEEDVHLAFGAVQIGLAEGFGSPAFRAAATQVDESAGLLADRMATIPEVGGATVALPGEDVVAQESLPRALRDAFRKHWLLLRLYAREAADDVPRLSKAEIEERLARATETIATLLGAATQVQTETLHEPLKKADGALTRSIDALVAEEPAAYDHLATALEHMADASDILIDGVIARLQG